MPDIRYVCLSDMHLGDENSLLTNLEVANPVADPLKPSPVMIQLVECLRSLVGQNANKAKKPTLILNGDIFELALATDNVAAMVFERFIELVMPPGDEMFGRIVYIPGNHDHHLWESARETQYANYISAKTKPGSMIDAPWHTTSMFVESAGTVPLSFPTHIVRRYPHLKDFVIEAAYPNFGLISGDRKKCVIFSHGHYIESLYLLMSNLATMMFPSQQMPVMPWDVEAQNFAWIDFFWSTMGRSGNPGKDVEVIYRKMQDKEQFKKLLNNLAESLAKKYDLPGLGDAMEAAILKGAFGLAVDGVMGSERTQTDRLMSPDAEKGLWWYMNGPIRNQIDLECTKDKSNAPVPTDTTFVFGHTHKPFAEDSNFKEHQGWVNVYNSGGWVVEGDSPQPLHGASVVLVDDDLNTAAIRLYNEIQGSGSFDVKVEEAAGDGTALNPLTARLRELVNPAAAHWKAFSDTTARAIRVRQQNVRATINQNV